MSVLSTSGLFSTSLPRDHDLKSWTYPCDEAVAEVTWPPAAGVLALQRIVNNETILDGNVSLYMSTAGAGLADCYFGFYSPQGALLASTAECSASLALAAQYVAVSGLSGTTFPAGFSPPAWVWIALLAGTAGTLPKLGSRYGVSPLVNLNIATAELLSATTGTGLTLLPASFDPASLTGASAMPWLAFA